MCNLFFVVFLFCTIYGGFGDYYSIFFDYTKGNFGKSLYTMGGIVYSIPMGV